MGGRSHRCPLCGKWSQRGLAEHMRQKHNVGGHKGAVGRLDFSGAVPAVVYLEETPR